MLWPEQYLGTANDIQQRGSLAISAAQAQLGCAAGGQAPCGAKHCSAEQKQQETLRSPNHPLKRARNSDTKVEACRKKCKRYLTVPDAIKVIDLSISQSKDREENTRELRIQTRRYKKSHLLMRSTGITRMNR